MLDFDAMLCCEWLCKIGVCFCVAVFVDEWCLKLMSGYYVVVGYAKFVCMFDLSLMLMIGV